MKVHEAIARALVENGVDTMFGIIGDANLFMVDRYTRDHPTTYVPATNEEGAVLMAGGYSATSGRVGRHDHARAGLRARHGAGRWGPQRVVDLVVGGGYARR